MNQVEFLGLQALLRQCNLATFKMFAENLLKKKNDVQVCHQRLSSAFNLLLILLCSLI